MDNNQILEKAKRCVETCLEFRKTRFQQIQKYEDMYFGKTKPALKGRFNIPIPVLEGFVNTLESKIDDSIRIEFKRGRESTLKTAKKITALWEKDSAPDRGNYNGADLDAKKLAIFSGFGVLKLVPTSTPEYRQDLIAIDYHDVIFEPYGGSNLEQHLFKGQLNIFKSKKELIDGVKNGIFNKEETESLINSLPDNTKETQEEMYGKSSRFLAMGLNPQNYNYSPDSVFNLVELVIKIDGKDWYILFSYVKNKIIRAVPLIKIFSSGLSPWVSWHTERNPVSFLSRSPIDSVYPIAEAMRILINQNFDNIQKRNWDMVLYNARKIIDPSQFEYRPNGLIRVKLEQGESMASAYAKMETPDTSSITINLLQFLNNFLGEKTGITPASQGTADEDKVGIYFGNMKQTADRFGLLNKFYTQAHIDIAAKRYKGNLIDHLPNRGFMVKFIGLLGLQEEELTKKELEDDFSISVSSANIESQNDELTRKKQETSLLTIIKDSELKIQVGKKWLLKEVLRLGEYSEDAIREALSGEEGGDSELMAEAARSIEAIEQGELPKINRGANTAFIRKIVLYATDNVEDELIYNKMMNYAIDHLQIAEQNAKIMLDITGVQESQQQMQQPENKTELQSPELLKLPV